MSSGLQRVRQDDRPQAAVGLRPLRGQALMNRGELRGGRVGGHPGSQDTKHRQHRALAALGRCRVLAQGNPELEIEWKREPVRHHADDDVRHRVQCERAADDGRITAEAALPLTVADHHHAIRAVALVVRQQVASEVRGRARNGKGRRADFGHANRVGIAVGGGEILLDAAIGAEMLNRLDAALPLVELVDAGLLRNAGRSVANSIETTRAPFSNGSDACRNCEINSKPTAPMAIATVMEKAPINASDGCLISMRTPSLQSREM